MRGAWHSRADATQSSGPIWSRSLAEFIPSAQGLEKELQELAAVLECTQLSFLPPEWQEKVAQPGGRSHLQERMVAIRQLLEEMVNESRIEATYCGNGKEQMMAANTKQPGLTKARMRR